MVIEVTSHALTQNRVSGVEFHTAIYSNLTHEHLDYHNNIEAYWQAKQKLFTEFQPKFSVLNVEDPFGQRLFLDPRLYKAERSTIAYTTESSISSNLSDSSTNLITTHNLNFTPTGMHALVKTPWGEGMLSCPLLGRFNLSNVLAALAAVCLQGVELSEVLQAIPYLKTVPGRMMRLGGQNGEPIVVIDYAHKPDALALVLKALRPQCRGKLGCIVGCGGDRDRSKRALMAANAEQLSDVLILTQDNPRTEDPKQIFEDMLQGIQDRNAVVIEYDRKLAIKKAILNAKSDDLILIAGKGHEEYQIVGNHKIPFSDQVEVEAALQERRRV